MGHLISTSISDLRFSASKNKRGDTKDYHHQLLVLFLLLFDNDNISL